MEVLQVSVVLESDAQPLSLVHGADIKMEIDLMLMHKINEKHFQNILTASLRIEMLTWTVI